MTDKSYTFKESEYMSARGFVTVAFMTFAFFFGAGNLIFPPFSGSQTGHAYGLAYTGYILVDIGLSILAIIAVSIAGRASFLTVDLPKWMGLVFWLAIYLIIGPIFAIPRVSVVSYDIGISPFLNGSSSPLLFVFTALFFTVSLVLVFFPGRLVNIIGGVLTPLLLLFLIVLYVVMMVTPHAAISSTPPISEHKAFGYGLLQGYLTMDALAALAFGAIIIKSVHNFGVKSHDKALKMTVYTSILAGILLALVYFGLFYMGAINSNMAGSVSNGGQILTSFVKMHLGVTGQVILSLIIILACLTTAVGLIAACAEYFNFLYKAIPYRVWAFLLTLISLFLANLGLNNIISLSVPVVVSLYPVAIIVVFAALVRKFIHINHNFVVVNIIIAFALGVLDAIHSVSPSLFAHTWLINLPFFDEGVTWLVPCTIVFVLNMIITNIFFKQQDSVHN